MHAVMYDYITLHYITSVGGSLMGRRSRGPRPATSPRSDQPADSSIIIVTIITIIIMIIIIVIIGRPRLPASHSARQRSAAEQSSY